ncbi:hypothetical protein RDWZM_000840 [Blomia tropicalis]|uniref:Uncharacterized protein n=1 Tax=Blomia tropicalis TaxID=40697 RepID=A0A9Q0RQ67_BLOTA|nr:hypothetical protein BLOT_009478 [Blomia tropicalis]KAJ6222295.1 hypothetical protein RDWZM_000840 [Blomia tropicalis]
MKFYILIFLLFALYGTSLTDSSDENEVNDDQIEPISPATPQMVEVSSSTVPIASTISSIMGSTNSPMQPIMRAIEIIEFVSKFSNSDGSFGVRKIQSALEDISEQAESMNVKRSDVVMTKTTDPLTALSSLAIYGTMKVTSIILSVAMYIVSMLMPGSFAGPPRSSINEYSTHFDHIDYNTISDSIRSIPIRSFELFEINETDCQNRAMCEVGQSISNLFPTISKVIRFIAEHFNVRSINYNDAIIRGLGWTDCNARYAKSCPRSPFKKFHQLLNTFTKFY